MTRHPRQLPDADRVLAQAMIGAHAEAKANPGEWARREAHYLHSLAWRVEGTTHSVVMQGRLTPGHDDLLWFLAQLPERLRPVEIRYRYDKHQLWFTLEPTPAPEVPALRADPKVRPPSRVKV